MRINVYMLGFVAIFGAIVPVSIFWVIREWFMLYTAQIFEITLAQLLELPVGDILMSALWFFFAPPATMFGLVSFITAVRVFLEAL